MWEHISPTCPSRNLYDELALGIRVALHHARNIDLAINQELALMRVSGVVSTNYDAIAALAAHLIAVLHNDNPAFNEARFRMTAGLPRG